MSEVERYLAVEWLMAKGTEIQRNSKFSGSGSEIWWAREFTPPYTTTTQTNNSQQPCNLQLATTCNKTNNRQHNNPSPITQNQSHKLTLTHHPDIATDCHHVEGSNRPVPSPIHSGFRSAINPATAEQPTAQQSPRHGLLPRRHENDGELLQL